MQKSWIWDVPTRLFHWSIVGLIAFSWWSAENAEMQWHYYSGLTVCSLLIFRLLWGIFGTSTARFRQFVKGAAPVIAYIKDKPEDPVVGHNPLGGLSVVAMLLVLLTQVVTGLFAVDVDGLESGPLSYMIEFDQGRVMSSIHNLSFNLLIVLIAVHIFAILFYLIVRKSNLITPMITGTRMGPDGRGALRAPAWRLVVAVVIAATATWWISKGMPI